MATWVHPASGRVSSLPGPRVSPGGIGSTNHGGWDITGPTGTPIYAATGGTVTYSGWRGGYGQFIEVKQADGSYQRYGHMSGRDVKVGDTVDAGDQIGKMGSTGRSTGPHLHYENRDAKGKLLSPTGDESLNNEYKINSRPKGGQKGDGTDAAKDGKKGEGDGDPSKKDEHEKTAKNKDPLKKGDKNDIKGSAGNYKETQTSTIVGRMPTHEPWRGHPKSTEGPRQALRGDGGANNGGEGTDADRGSGGSSASPGGGSGGGGSGGGSGARPPGNDDGRATNPNGNQQQIGEQIYNRLISKGYTPGAADAAVGNFMGEGLNKVGGYGTAIKYDPSGKGKPGWSRGFGQWRNERGTDLENFAAGKYEGGWRNTFAQVDFFDHELKTKYPSLYNKMQTSNDTASITRDLVYDYEKPAEHLRASTTQQRIANARGFANKRKANKPRTGDDGMNKADANAAPSPAGGSKSSGAGSSAAPTS